MNEQRTASTDDEGGVSVYGMVLAVALVIGLGLALYLVAYRQEIVAIVTQSPT